MPHISKFETGHHGKICSHGVVFIPDRKGTGNGCLRFDYEDGWKLMTCKDKGRRNGMCEKLSNIMFNFSIQPVLFSFLATNVLEVLTMPNDEKSGFAG